MKPRSGKFGNFWGCSNFPNCRATRPFGNRPPEEMKLAWKTKLYEVNGEIVSTETPIAVPLDYEDPDA